MPSRRRYKKNNQIIQQSPQLINTFEPKTQHQKDYIRSIVESDVTVCYGSAGTGKSMTAIAIMCEWLMCGKIDNILVSRSIVGCDNEIGFLPGGVESKIEPYMAPYIEYFTFFLGKDRFYRYLKNKNIMFCPVELLRGHTYNDSIMLAEEAQNMTPKQIKLFLSRLGKNSKAIIVGDNRQSDIHNNGLSFCIDNFHNINGLNFIQMTKEDILRHAIIPQILDVFDENGV